MLAARCLSSSSYYYYLFSRNFKISNSSWVACGIIIIKMQLQNVQTLTRSRSPLEAQVHRVHRLDPSDLAPHSPKQLHPRQVRLHNDIVKLQNVQTLTRSRSPLEAQVHCIRRLEPSDLAPHSPKQLHPRQVRLHQLSLCSATDKRDRNLSISRAYVITQTCTWQRAR